MSSTTVMRMELAAHIKAWWCGSAIRPTKNPVRWLWPALFFVRSSRRVSIVNAKNGKVLFNRDEESRLLAEVLSKRYYILRAQNDKND